MRKFKVTNEKDENYENAAKFIAIVPWMMEYKFASPDDLYVFGYVWNCVNHFGQLRMHYKSDAVRCSMYVCLTTRRFLDAIDRLIDAGYLRAVQSIDDITYLYPIIGEERLFRNQNTLQEEEAQA